MPRMNPFHKNLNSHFQTLLSLDDNPAKQGTITEVSADDNVSTTRTTLAMARLLAAYKQ